MGNYETKKQVSHLPFFQFLQGELQFLIPRPTEIISVEPSITDIVYAFNQMGIQDPPYS